jgi:hypothetical protein
MTSDTYLTMKSATSSTEPELASGWPLSRVETCLNAAQKDLLVSMIQRRYEERFLEPIRTLRSARGHSRGYGFAILALCSLLIESLQSYRYGLPTTHDREYGALGSFTPPPEYEIPSAERKSGTQVFVDFFAFAPHQALFPSVDGGTYYTVIRNGLLHQAQTKGGWKIRIGQTQLWNTQDKVVDRNKFADALTCAFNQYVEELNRDAWDSDIWCKARRKIWWLVKLSS